jgi:hypothetical protein
MIPREPRNAQEACDVIAITHLAAAYSEAISRGQVAEACMTYAEDGGLHSPTTESAIGRDAVTATITATCASLEFVFQTVHQGLVEVDGDTARARFQITDGPGASRIRGRCNFWVSTTTSARAPPRVGGSRGGRSFRTILAAPRG